MFFSGLLHKIDVLSSGLWLEYQGRNEQFSMTKKPARDQVVAESYRLAGLRRVAYWGGRLLQVMGLLLMWWILLLFTSVTGMSGLLRLGLIALGVFYAGWGCTAWARKRS